MKILGISGTNGAGKDLLGSYMAEKHSFLFVSVTEMLREECRARNLPVERENLRAISSEWRHEGGLGVLVDKAVAVYNQSPEGSYQGLILASLRNPGEPDRIHELGGNVIWVDATPEVRYQRVKSADRGRTEDKKTYEQFLAEQEAEMHGIPGDPTALKISAVKDRSDIFINNDGEDIQAFEEHIDFTLTEAGLL